jgi:predicted transcriptional regulator
VTAAARTALCGTARLSDVDLNDMLQVYHAESFMRILIDLTELQLKELDTLATRQERSRASVVRDAVDAYLSRKKSAAPSAESFGLWADAGKDGLVYQEELRSEW